MIKNLLRSSSTILILIAAAYLFPKDSYAQCAGVNLPVATLPQIPDCSGNSTPTLVGGHRYNVPTIDDVPNSCGPAASYIDNFTFNTISNLATGCNGNTFNYVFYNNISTVVTPGNSYNFSIGGSPYLDALGYAIWMDYNNDGDFDDVGEMAFSSPADVTDVSGSIIIPADAVWGITRMRVRTGDWTTFNDADANLQINSGETEDYVMTIGNAQNLTFTWTSDPSGFNSSGQYPVVAPGTDTTYYLTVYDSISGCSRVSSVIIHADEIYPAAFGQNIWNAYAYNGSNFNTYSGAYHESNLNFDSRSRWPDGASPSYSTGYIGCGVTTDNHSMKYKRKGFPCGTYSIDIPDHDDECYVYVNDILVFQDLGCCDNHINIWTGHLGSNSKIEFQWKEGGGGSVGSLAFNLISSNPDAAGSIMGTGTVCPGTQAVNYSVPAISGASYYIWSLPTGATIASGDSTNSVSVDFASNAADGNVTVSGVNECGNGTATSYSVTIDPFPVKTLITNSPFNICSGGTVILSASAASSYLWSSGETTQAINVTSSGNYSCIVFNSSGCFVESDTAAILVNSNPSVSLSSFSNVGACNSSFVLTGGSPAGGTFSGTSVSGGNFDPSVGAGTYTITYSFTDGNGCSGSDSKDITVDGLPTVTLASFNHVGACNSSFALTGGSPAGGIYSGSGVSGGQFYPSVGAGTYHITYTYYDNNGCWGSDAKNITVDAIPTVTLSSFNNAGICNSPIALTGGSPAGGTYSGTSVSGGNFDPSVGAGTYTITYSYTDGNGCSDSDSKVITVDGLPTVTLVSFNNVGACNSSFALTGGSPAGGIFSGSGVSGGQFYPSIGAGTYHITYTYYDGNGCWGSDAKNMIVEAAPVVTLNSFNDVCTSTSPISLTGGSPAGGTYSGTGVSGNMFNPSVGAGSYNITYSYTDNNGCSGSAMKSITVNALPMVTVSSFNDVCFDASAIALSGGSPAGGDYTGNGITLGWFEPSVAGIGTTTMAYTYTDGNGCSNSATSDITVNALPTVTLGSFNDVCTDASAFALAGGSPAGGDYTGNGITAGLFDPANAGTGTTTITYSYTDGNGCSNSATSDITVNALPTVTLGSFNDVCSDASAFALTGGSPAGGDFTGNGITTGWFDPANAGTGTTTVTYTYTDGNGCSNSATSDITVNALPTVTLGSFNDVCSDASTFALTGGSPAGGDYTGNGITTGWFDPANAGTGTTTVTYSYTDGNGCSSSATSSITVNASPTVTLDPFNDVCSGDPGLILSGGSPAGGVYSGNGVTGGNTFDPATAGNGTSVITYTYTDWNRCSSSASQSITVNICTGIEKATNIQAVNLFPNPAHALVSLELADLSEVQSVKVSDLTGKVLMQPSIAFERKSSAKQSAAKLQLDMSKFAKGIYFVSINFKNRIVVKKLIVE